MADVGYVLLLHLSHLRAEVVDVLHLALAGLERVVFQKKLFELMRCIVRNLIRYANTLSILSLYLF